VGANARRRRERRAAERLVRVQSVPQSVGLAELNRMARRQCSDCGNVGIAWSTVGALAQGDGPHSGDARGVLPLVGASAEAWTCSVCGGFGAFEQSWHTGAV
jgi:hypothetical protein